jgi:hypothetical protein
MICRNFIFVMISIMLLACSVAAQSNSVSGQDRSNNSQNKEEEGYSINEMRSKWRIKAEEKEYQEIVNKGEEAAKIGDEISRVFLQNRRLTSQDQEKLAQLEKLSKKIRNALGGNNKQNKDETETPTDLVYPTSLDDAVKKLAETTANLHDELKKSTRYSISVRSIEAANYVLDLVGFIRQHQR